MSFDDLFDFFKKINFRRILPVLLCSVLLLCSSISGFAADVSPDAKNEWFLLPFNYADDFNQKGSFDSVSGTFNSSGGSYSGQYRHFSVATDSTAVMPAFERGHSYLFYMTFTSVGSQSGSVSSGSIRHNWGDWTSSLPLDSARIIHNSSNYANGTNTYTTIWQLSNINYSHIINTASQFQIDFGSSVSTSGRIGWALYALDITYTSESEVYQIVAAINNQTTNIMNAGSGFGGTTSGIQSGNDDLSGFIDDYTEIEQSMHDKFVETQAALNGDFTGFSWGSLSTCLNWVSDYLQQIYLNSGDFKMMITLPLLLGIALFFIGRGSLVFGEMTRDKSSDKANKDLDFTFRD